MTFLGSDTMRIVLVAHINSMEMRNQTNKCLLIGKLKNCAKANNKI